MKQRTLLSIALVMTLIVMLGRSPDVALRVIRGSGVRNANKIQ
ncbi:MAG: hypothetical protein WCA42_02480 [Desulfobacterales bacterium]